jgi:phage-related protein
MKPLHWMGNTLKVTQSLPEEVRYEVGYSLYLAQQGDKATNTVPLLGFNGSRVLKAVLDHDSNTYRAVYSVKLAEAVYVLHVFQKKSVSGIATPKPDMDLIKTRLSLAEKHYKENYGRKTRKEQRNDRSA